MKRFCLFLLPLFITGFFINPGKIVAAFCLDSVSEGKLLYASDIKVGAEKFDEYLPIIRKQKIAVVANQTSMVGQTHLVDTLLSLGAKIKCVFAPEHGFRGNAGAGEIISNSEDKKTGLPIISLYGGHLKPTEKELNRIDIVLFDIQDAGARFYTYISTLQYVMEACAEQHKLMIILDRPNPNGYYIDGPVLDPKFKSFVGLNKIPIVHGLTMGEYARMLNGEKWLQNGIQCEIKIITVSGYTHRDHYQLPIPPSPNLPNMTSVYLYPSLCLFEGTTVSVGRGTSAPFQWIGYPGFLEGNMAVVPKSVKGLVKNPPYEDTLCSGILFKSDDQAKTNIPTKLRLDLLMHMYDTYPDKNRFFNSFFNNLSGTDQLRVQIKNRVSEELIRQSWQEQLDHYKKIRKQYLLYEDFE